MYLCYLFYLSNRDAPIDAKIVADKVVEEVEDTPKVAPEEPEAIVAKVVEPVVEVVTPVVEETSEATPAVVVVENGKAEEKKEVEVEKVAESGKFKMALFDVLIIMHY